MLAKARGSPRHPCQVRCFLDLSSTGSQLRFLQNSLRPARAALGFIELAELQSVQLLQGSPSYCRTIPALAQVRLTVTVTVRVRVRVRARVRVRVRVRVS